MVEWWSTILIKLQNKYLQLSYYFPRDTFLGFFINFWNSYIVGYNSCFWIWWSIWKPRHHLTDKKFTFIFFPWGFLGAKYKTIFSLTIKKVKYSSAPFFSLIIQSGLLFKSRFGRLFYENNQKWLNPVPCIETCDTYNLGKEKETSTFSN